LPLQTTDRVSTGSFRWRRTDRRPHRVPHRLSV